MDGTRAGVRTANMPYMLVTLDVLRLRGWLNADAPCRVTPRHVEGDTSGKRREDGLVGTAHARVCAPETCLPCS